MSGGARIAERAGMKHAILMSAVLLAACATEVVEDAPQQGGGKADGTGSSYQLPGFDETLLVGSDDGKLAVVHVGDAFAAREVPLEMAQSPTVIRARDDRFYALYATGELAIIDAATAKVSSTLVVGEAAQDLEWAADGKVFVSTGSRVDTVDLATGARVESLDLASLRIGTGSVETRRMLRLDDRLFVQVARTRSDGRPDTGALAVIEGGDVAKVIELDGINPDFDLVHDARRGQLYVTCAGVRPSNTGVLVRIDLATLTIHDRIAANSGWQGIVAFGDPFETLFIIYHTSTPTTSSHLFSYSVAEDGTLEKSSSGTIVDAFDGLDAVSLNESGTLVAMANHCLAGFCIGGAGINFIDAATAKKLPKLLAAQLGFQPVIVAFSR